MKALCFIATSLYALTVSASLLALTPAPVPAAQAKPDKLPDAPGKETVTKVCGSCHTVDLIPDSRMTVANWMATVESMKEFGATASDAEFQTVKDYIVVNFALLEVNKAPAKDISQVLRVDEKIAADVVAYREKQGPFKTVDDVKRAPGLDATTLDTLAPRLMFGN
jgi:competence protein ComEA